ncbi:hypothetical protein [Paenibacillus monticola]|uniref:Uncharacterized protein n=1 Tax=Paenibacillus monticola TaxID=2666075 RepID=A0A7X2KZQ9_9BACL|nr:hypothetical protein [Paenibacillus monticola]MRN51967.1 hypothetical protein [Paenibacillus monticola]
MDWDKLVKDLRESNALAKAAAEAIPDGGSANLDSVFLCIPRQPETKVLNAIQKAGLYCRAKRRWIGSGYMINPDSSGQGDKRCKAVTVMYKELAGRGWDVLTYRKVD